MLMRACARRAYCMTENFQRFLWPGAWRKLRYFFAAAVYRTRHTSTKFSRGTLYVYIARTVYLTSTELAPSARLGPTRGVS